MAKKFGLKYSNISKNNEKYICHHIDLNDSNSDDPTNLVIIPAKLHPVLHNKIRASISRQLSDSIKQIAKDSLEEIINTQHLKKEVLTTDIGEIYVYLYRGDKLKDIIIRNDSNGG